MKKYVFLILFLGCYSSFAYEADSEMEDVEKSIQNIQLQSDSSDFQKIFEFAQMGIPEDQYHLARLYEKGKEVQKDMVKSLFWYEKSASNGDQDAVIRLSWLYRNGPVELRNFQKSFYYCQIAANFGCARSACSLGDMYRKGIGTQLNLQESLKWYWSSASKGDKIAQFSLAISYDFGIPNVLSKDIYSAINWYEEAANQGHVDSMFNLAVTYEEGDGVPVDLEKAKFWYGCAADRGDRPARRILERLKCKKNNRVEDDADALLNSLKRLTLKNDD